MTRPNTPDRINPDGSRTIKTKRACNGCGISLGDISDDEWTAAINGRPLPDVRRECPSCAPTAPPAACNPMKVFGGDMLCLEGECDHDGVSTESYCEEVGEEIVCATHSQFAPGFEDAYEVVTHAEPWPCTHSTPFKEAL
ncbi:hypothetical protein [Streptomyces sp. SID10815]|uniref:hypothetical protein n=1 Tax=Streptomyces sp. SID10815 TaxID=2706027 RepID=UPI0013C7C94A|nr:hypothetical protein [Streptomyces sp. SID10815]NEA52348.1 hypothetical protein [Streptomyces sp. SID10815]